MLRCHIHKSSAKNTAATPTSDATREDMPVQRARNANGSNMPAASAMRQNADAVGPMCTHFTNTAEVLISTAPSSIVASAPRASWWARAASDTPVVRVFQCFDFRLRARAPFAPRRQGLDRVGEGLRVVVHRHAVG